MKTEHVWKDGIYEGCLMTYEDGMVIFHPYIPLSMYGQPMPRVDREYFTSHGWDVPPDH